ncbi:MAG: hypothetical protein MRJ94_07830 [Nitrospirales bacterium]|nr:hypothetical protein [Nitrospirales bacterium]
MRKEEAGYVAGDIKSGSGEEGDEDKGKLKKSYAVQLGLYTDILERIQLSASRWGFIWDIHGKEVRYDFTQPQGIRTPQTWWDLYAVVSANAPQEILDATPIQTQAAYSSGDRVNCVIGIEPCLLLNLQKHP